MRQSSKPVTVKTSIWTIKRIQRKYFFVFKIGLEIVITWSHCFFIVPENFNKKT